MLVAAINLWSLICLITTYNTVGLLCVFVCFYVCLGGWNGWQVSGQGWHCMVNHPDRTFGAAAVVAEPDTGATTDMNAGGDGVSGGSGQG